jgi:hypothetical protein
MSVVLQKQDYEPHHLQVVCDGNPLIDAVNALEIVASEAQGKKAKCVFGQKLIVAGIRGHNRQSRRHDDLRIDLTDGRL